MRTNDNLVSGGLKIIAHRGFSGVAPENTLPAFQKALELGVDGIELDVHQSRDGKIIVIHDPTINRTTKGKGRVSDLDSGEISSFGIPLLVDVLKLVDGKATLYIEIKKGDSFYPEIEKNILDLIEAHKARSWCILHSFEKETLIRIHQLDQKITLLQTLFVPALFSSLYFEKTFDKNPVSHFRSLEGININHTALNPSLVKKIHRSGMKIIAWTVNDPDNIRRMMKLGVNGIISNFPDRVKKIRDEK